MTEDYSEFFDDFAETAIYNNGGGDISVPVFVDYDIETFNEYSTEKSIVITIPRSIVAPSRGATITIGSTVYTLGETLNDDDFIVQMEATK